MKIRTKILIIVVGSFTLLSTQTHALNVFATDETVVVLNENTLEPEIVGNMGETTDPETGGNTGGTTDPGTGGNTGETTDPSTGGNTGGTTDPGTGGNTGGTTDPSTGENTGGTTDPSTGENTGGTTDPGTGGNTGGTTDPSTGGNTGGTTNPGTGGNTTIPNIGGGMESINGAVVPNTQKPINSNVSEQAGIPTSNNEQQNLNTSEGSEPVDQTSLLPKTGGEKTNAFELSLLTSVTSVIFTTILRLKMKKGGVIR